MRSHRHLAALGILAVLVAGCSDRHAPPQASPAPSPSLAATTPASPSPTTPTALPPISHDLRTRLARAFVRFASHPGPTTWAALHTTPEGLRIGLASGPVVRFSPATAAAPATWVSFAPAGSAGTSDRRSALDVVRDARGRITDAPGTRSSCHSADQSALAEFRPLSRISIRPRHSSSCTGWFSVDLFVDPRTRELVAVTFTASGS